MKIAIVILCIFCSCKSFSQELLFTDGIYTQKPVSRDTSAHRYSIDNKTFNINKVFIYDYYFTDSSLARRKFFSDDMVENGNKAAALADYYSPPPAAIDLIKLTVTDNPKSVLHNDSLYTQTIIKYEYINRSGELLSSEETGVIDNIMNIWLHPPRSHYFKILEIDPFPFINIPDSSKEWNWFMQAGPHYGDARWKEWPGLINIQYSYKKAKNQWLDTKLGKLDCKVTDAVASCELGKTYLRSFFHPYYGFVRLEYTNINGTKLVMQLIALKD